MQKPDFVFRRNGRVHLNRRGRQFSRLLAAEVCASALIVGSNAGYAMFRGSEKGTGYSLHSPASPLLPLPCVTVCHHISTGIYQISFPGVKRPGRGVDDAASTSAEVKQIGESYLYFP
jgi:hypothetical protein